ncbi:hypothetical protein [Lutispora thermophila]|uniref:DUF4129 domain-containing protein n=1 Tax=Lutispora thermophila DSM 19022 TaxID=1122184 RepID=A0A1M6H2T9_9FIRM|nr:hypothetical protein [Lutispora thermophila]SHJ16521.1 hypothetical protein SAMN02745176_02625 [Lutispora thermophila DSM 19022]
MKQLVFIRILSDVSIMFALCCYLLSFIGDVKLSGITYLIVCVMIFGAHEIKRGSRKKAYGFCVLFLVIFMFAKTLVDMIFIGILVFYSMYTVFKGLGEIGYYMAVERFNKGLIILAAMFLLALFAHNMVVIETKSAPFMIIFLVTAVILIRSFRLLQYNEDITQLNRINIRYSIIVVALSFGLSIPQVRQYIFKVVGNIYDLLVQGIVFIFYGVFIIMGKGIEYAIAFMKALMEKKSIGELLESQGSYFDNVEIYNTESLIEIINRSIIFKIIINVLVTILIFLALYHFMRMLMKNNHIKRNDEGEYMEIREFITRDRNHKKLRKITLPFMAGKYDEYIRYYYQKFMRLCVTNGVEILKADTTQDISRKSETNFDKASVDEMRKIYIKIRYGEDSGDKDNARRFYNYYKRLKR